MGTPVFIKQKKNFYIYSILWKCQQSRYPRRIDFLPNKLMGTPVRFTSCVMYENNLRSLALHG